MEKLLILKEWYGKLSKRAKSLVVIAIAIVGILAIEYIRG